MPIFEFKCDTCQTVFERLLRSDHSEPLACPSCGQGEVTRQLSTFAAHAGPASKSEPVRCPSGGICPTPGACGLN